MIKKNDSEKRGVGRPRTVKDKETLIKKIDEFFKEREEKRQPPTISGLALHLGFMDRASLYEYMKPEHEYSHILKGAVARIEDFAEKVILKGEGSAAGAIFWLKNRGWRDGQTVEHSGSVTVMNKVVVDGSELDFGLSGNEQD